MLCQRRHLENPYQISKVIPENLQPRADKTSGESSWRRWHLGPSIPPQPTDDEDLDAESWQRLRVEMAI